MEELTTKASILQHIYNAKRAHQEWVRKADRLVNGLDGYQGKKVDLNVDKTYIPLDASSCEFGKWFNSHSFHLGSIPSIGKFITRIDEHHIQLHKTYENIYTLFFVMPENRSFVHKLVTFNSKKVSKEERNQAKIHLGYLKHSSTELLEVLEILEEKVRNLDYNELKKAVEVGSAI